MGFTDTNGRYEISLTANASVYITVSDENYFATSRQEYLGSIQQMNLSTYPLASNDLSVNLASGRNRPGFTIPLYLNVTNIGKLTNGGKLELQLDNFYSFQNASIMPSSVVANLLTWQIPPISSSQTSYIIVDASLNPNIALGTLLNSTLTLTPTTVDINAANNTSSVTSMVTGSFDPNDKSVSPAGRGQHGYISDTTMLDYIIRFQNMGTDTAFTIVVADKISLFLDLSSIQTIEASHPYIVSVKNDTILWTFPHIPLPDNKVNEPGSHGQIHYRISKEIRTPLTQRLKHSSHLF